MTDILQRLEQWAETPHEGDPMIDVLLDDASAAASEIATLRAALAEQARLNGMGSEREAIIRLLQNGIDINDASMRQHMGEATAQELRTARAWLGYMLAQVKAMESGR